MGKKWCSGFLFGTVLVMIAAAGGNKASGPSSGSPLAGIVGGKIGVSCYDSLISRSFLEQAAKLFMEKYPGAEVEVQTFSAMPEIRSSESGNTRTILVQAEDDPRGRIDYINRVNTALMSGEGADIYAADILPVYKYAESGQFENLETYMSGDPAWVSADFRTNILEAAKFHRGLWFMPLDYSFDYYAYDTVLLPRQGDFGPGSSFTTGALMDRAKPRFDGSAKLFDTLDYVPGPSGPGPGDMFNQLLSEYYPSLVDLENKQGNFNDGTFVKILESVKEYAGAGYIPRSTGTKANPEDMLRRTQGQQTDRYFFKLNHSFSLVSQSARGSGRRTVMRAAGSSGGIEDDDEIAGIRANQDGGIPFDFSQAYGINANSQNKRTAWEFLKFLLDREMQTSTALSPSALPVNNRAREEKAELILSGAFMGRGEPLDEKQYDILARYKAVVEELSDQINRYILQDTVINDMIAAEAAYFFNGTKTAAETAAVLQNRVNLYLHE